MTKKYWKRSQPETQIKVADAEEWEYMNPILNEGEPGYVLDTGELKIGNGKDRFDVLSSIGSKLSGDPIIVVPHGTDANYPRPDGIRVAYWLGSAEPANAIEEDLWSADVDTGNAT